MSGATMTSAPVQGVGGGEAPALDPMKFREVLGHYPTGVVVVTGIADDGAPVGMVIGSFTSVSLDPPIVAYLPSKTSRSFARLRESETFCVNVLGADQEHLCRLFAGGGGDKFADLEWTPTPGGAPILPGAVAWIECTLREVLDGGDHYIVLGDTTALGVQNPAPPLLFFQGGYGRFTHGSLAMPGGVDFIRSVQSAELLRDRLEELARKFSAQCDVAVPDGREGVLVFSASRGVSRTAGTLIGARLPIVAPIQPLLVDGSTVSEEEWTATGLDAEARSQAIEQLARVRERGWSLVLQGEMCEADLEDAVRRYSQQPRTPASDRDFIGKVAAMAPQREPESISPDEVYDVLYIAVPVQDSCGRTALTLKLSQLPGGVKGTEVLAWIEELQRAAQECSEQLTACDRHVEPGA
ncbi:flavin reductase family protein [Nocardioides sp. zg-536]|uniref:Flavin reductase family protein n=1 Tax=Nocardioides faecalis TaxID=2803858 RepID=A0A938Y9J9_9ACTN|nr:flavin reductase family protein [Nocardioides faecalis]MBM9460350.1 flavin reductase family protein [Nocardioides faecalis]MBS4751275.1 flavin reductase family protein [Nocardioides faecalis]QVI59822.1 flavin reductase family protein [Nocardioides faecalis]